LQETNTNIFRSEPIELSDLKAQLCSYILRRDDGNILVYGGGRFREFKEKINEIGGIRLQAITHRHEFTRYPDWVRNEFGTTRYCHEEELQACPETFGIDIPISGEMNITEDFKAMPTPGHCPGSTSYFWDSGHCVYAFLSDTLYIKGGEWTVDMSHSYGSPTNAAKSLRKIADSEFDVMLPGIFYDGLDFPTVSSSRLKAELDPLLERLDNGQV
jgi:glyoxylase-like metal-dependent hydrolase (beta-lactamase superfamily II)